MPAGIRAHGASAFTCTLGGALFAVLCGCGHNIRKILAHLRALLAAILASLIDAIAQPDRHPVTAQAA